MGTAYGNNVLHWTEIYNVEIIGLNLYNTLILKKMKKFLACMMISLFAFAFAANAQNTKKNVKKDAEVTYSVDIDCANCVKKLENTLPFVKGVKDLKVSLEKKTVWFKYDASKTTKEALKAEVEKQGYACKEADNSTK